MKKIFTFFAAALVGLCAVAQDDGPCPSVLSFQLSEMNADEEIVAAEQVPANNVMIELQLTNASQNLNGFNMEIERETAAGEVCENIVWMTDPMDEDYVGFSGYGATILAMASGTHNASWYENNLFKKADLKCNVKPTNGRLVIIEILSTLDPRFFPVLEEPTSIARFTVDMSTCEDGNYRLIAYDTPGTCSFSYTGGPEGNRAWTTDEPVVINLTKEGDIVKLTGDEPQPVEYDAFYVTGTFNGWSQDVANMTELVGNEEGTQFTGTVQLTNGAEFKVVTPTENGLVWFGGEDANQVGYFEINDGMLNQPITLMDGANFKVVGDGLYTITVMNPAKGLQEPLVMMVSKEATGISTVGVDANNGRIYDIQGRELKSVPEHGIYIQNGKKYVK